MNAPESIEFHTLRRDTLDAEAHKARLLHPNAVPHLATGYCRTCNRQTLVAIHHGVCPTCDGQLVEGKERD